MKQNKDNLTNIKFDGIDSTEHPKYSSAFVCEAELNGVLLTESEIDVLNEDTDLVGVLFHGS